MDDRAAQRYPRRDNVQKAADRETGSEGDSTGDGPDERPRVGDEIALVAGPPVRIIDRHFAPSYNPWDQRVCLVPDGDLFAALNHGHFGVKLLPGICSARSEMMFFCTSVVPAPIGDVLIIVVQTASATLSTAVPSATLTRT